MINDFNSINLMFTVIFTIFMDEKKNDREPILRENESISGIEWEPLEIRDIFMVLSGYHMYVTENFWMLCELSKYLANLATLQCNKQISSSVKHVPEEQIFCETSSKGNYFLWHKFQEKKCSVKKVPDGINLIWNLLLSGIYFGFHMDFLFVYPFCFGVFIF